jgi:hypothetical protein
MNRNAILIGLGAIAAISIYALYYISKNNSTEFSSEDAEYEELLRQYLIFKGLPYTAVNRLKYGNMKKEELENALGY